MAGAEQAGQADTVEQSEYTTLAALVAYDGTRFVGFQRQVAERGSTVQGALEAAINRIARKAQAGEMISLAAAGRTDSGVHAAGQVISFQTRAWLDADAWLRALNALTPPDIGIRAVRQVAPGFHARKSALARRYRYRIICTPNKEPLRERYAWRVAQRLDVDAMNRAAGELLGEHDFAAFGSSPWDRPSEGYRAHTVRRLTLSRCAWAMSLAPFGGVITPPDEIVCEFTANAFLTGMVRRIVGTLALVGQSRLSIDDVRGILAAREKAHPGAAAPPQGLCLTQVDYPTEWGLW